METAEEALHVEERALPLHRGGRRIDVDAQALRRRRLDHRFDGKAAMPRCVQPLDRRVGMRGLHRLVDRTPAGRLTASVGTQCRVQQPVDLVRDGRDGSAPADHEQQQAADDADPAMHAEPVATLHDGSQNSTATLNATERGARGWKVLL
jgi:hypothetical protein